MSVAVVWDRFDVCCTEVVRNCVSEVCVQTTVLVVAHVEKDTAPTGMCTRKHGGSVRSV